MIKNSQNVKLPELPDIDRPVKVADELQNLDIWQKSIDFYF